MSNAAHNPTNKDAGAIQILSFYGATLSSWKSASVPGAGLRNAIERLWMSGGVFRTIVVGDRIESAAHFFLSCDLGW